MKERKNMTVRELVDTMMEINTSVMVIRTNKDALATGKYNRSVAIAQLLYYETDDYIIQELGDKFIDEKVDDIFPWLSILEWDYDEDTWNDVTEQVETFLMSERADTWNEFINPTR